MRRLLVSALLAVVTAAPALADGGVFGKGVFGKDPVRDAIVAVRTPDQRALLRWDPASGTETLVIETTLQGEGTEFAWVLPLPAVPKIEASTTGVFPTLEVYCAARVHTDTAPWWLAIAGAGAYLAVLIRVWDRSRGAGIVLLIVGVPIALTGWEMLGVGMLRHRETMSLGASGGAGAVPLESSVRVLSRATVGVHETAVVTADDAGDLRRWLEENGFHAPAAIDPVVAAYIAEGWVFAASKVRADVASGDVRQIHPIAFTFPTPEAVYPMRLTGALNETLGIDLFVVADERASADGLEVACAIPGSVAEETEHREITRVAGDALQLTRLTGTLSGAATHRDIRFAWHPRETMVPEYHTPAAAATSAALPASLVLAAGLVLASIRSLSRSRRDGRAPLFAHWRFDAAVGGACCVVFAATWLALPTLPAESRILGGSDRGLRELIAQAPYFATVDAARAWLAPRAAEVDNPYTGEPMREEDSPGNYVLDQRDDGVVLTAVDPRRMSASALDSWSQDLSDFRSATPQQRVSIPGVVLGPDGEPVAGARVGILRSAIGLRRWPENPLDSDIVAETRDDGTFTLRVPLGFPCDVAVEAPGRPVLFVEGVDLRTAPAAPLRFEVADGTSVRGRVVDHAGEPVPGASVWWSPYPSADVREFDVSADGVFEIPGVPADAETVTVTIHHHSDPKKCPRAKHRLVPGAPPVEIVIDLR